MKPTPRQLLALAVGTSASLALASCTPEPAKSPLTSLSTPPAIVVTRATPPAEVLTTKAPVFVPSEAPLSQPAPSASPTPRPTPTLEPRAQDDYVLTLISENGECDFPCLWGIAPGKGTERDLAEALSPVSVHLRSPLFFLYPSYGNLMMSLPDQRPVFVGLQVGAAPGRSDRKITRLNMHVSIEVRGESDERFRQPDVEQAAEGLALPSVLTKFGPPDRILLREFIPWQIAGRPPFYDLILLYDNLGFAVAYYHPSTPLTSDNTVRHCFSPDRVEAIEVTVHSPDDGRSLDYIINTFLGMHMHYFEELIEEKVYIDVEEATGVTVTDFYETYRTPGTICLYSPADIWGD